MVWGCAVHTEMNGQVWTQVDSWEEGQFKLQNGMNKTTGSLAGMRGLGSAESAKDSEQRKAQTSEGLLCK